MKTDFARTYSTGVVARSGLVGSFLTDPAARDGPTVTSPRAGHPGRSKALGRFTREAGRGFR